MFGQKATFKRSTRKQQARTGRAQPTINTAQTNGVNMSVLIALQSRVHAMLLLLLLSSFSSVGHGQEPEFIEFNIPAQTVPNALSDFSRQANVELAFSELGYENVQTKPVIGRYRKEQALEMLLAGTGLRVKVGADDSVIVLAALNASGDVDFDGGDPSMVLLAQAAVNASQGPVNDTGAHAGSDDQTPVPAPRSRAEGDLQPLEEITVTGSRIRGVQTASPVVTISREEIDMAGFATVEEVVEYLPQNFGGGATLDGSTNGQNQNQAVGGRINNDAGGTSVNLRGLGADSTLVLVNGRRMSPSGATASFTNIGSIPVSAIERVEVLTDGASAIYGSDAIGGVINFILRESFDGAETRLRYGSDSRGDTSSVQFAQSFGTSWDGGTMLVGYEYYDSDPLSSSDRSFTASTDLSPFGGTDRRVSGGNPGTIVAGGQTFAIPEGQDGTALTPADFAGLENTQNFFDAGEFSNVLPALEQHSAFIHLRQAVGSVELFGAARFFNSEREIRFGRGNLTLSVTGDDPATPEIEGNPWFIDPTDTGLTSVRVLYGLDDDFGPFVTAGEIDAAGATLGARFEFGENWESELAANWSKEDSRNTSGEQIDFGALFGAVNSPDPDLAFNPFGDGSNTNPNVIESLFRTDRFRITDFENELWSANFDVNGEVIETAGGAVRVVAGVDFREESLSFSSSTRSIDRKRDVLSFYAEVFLPLVSDKNRRAGVERLEISIAARREDYSDFGSSTDPKLGIVWSPTESLMLRGTIGTSFRAPSLTDLDDSILTRWRYFPEDFFGRTPFGVLIKDGRNPDLDAQEATTWTTGFEWTPVSLDGLSLAITYFDVDFKGRIERPAINALAALTDPRFASVLILDPSDEEISAFVNSPSYDPDALVNSGFGPYPAEDIISGAVPVGGIFDNRLTNLAQSVVTGAELQLTYAFDTVAGSFNLGLNGSYMFDFERRLLSTDPLFDEVDLLGRPVDFRGRGSLNWNRGNWMVSGFVNYIDGYTDNVSNPARAVDSWTTVDLTVAYSTDESAGFLSDTRLALTTQNLLDEDPPFVDTIGAVGYDATNASPLGRFFALQLTKVW